MDVEQIAAQAITIWPNGSYCVQSIRDAEISERCPDDPPLLHINTVTHEPVTFMDPQERIKLYEALLPPRQHLTERPDAPATKGDGS